MNRIKKNIIWFLVIIIIPFYTSLFIITEMSAEAAVSKVKSNKIEQILNKIEEFESYIAELYEDCELQGKLNYRVFRLAFIGYINMNKKLTNKRCISIIDYSKLSPEKRFFVIDILSRELLYNTLVAHGKNTGGNIPKYFSNENNSRKTSLGFFIAAEAYYGRHNYSLRLDGVEPVNNNARNRAIVIHGAEYVSPNYIEKHGMLGRSGGCPALPIEKSTNIINTIKNKSCLFIYYNCTEYLGASEYINAENALNQYRKQLR